MAKSEWELITRKTSIYKIRKGKRMRWVLVLGSDRYKTINAVVLKRRGQKLKLLSNGKVLDIFLKASYKNWSEYYVKNAKRILKVLDRMLEKMRPEAKKALEDAKTLRGPYHRASDFNQLLEQIFIMQGVNKKEMGFIYKYLEQLQRADYIQWKN
ncbi:MAG: hypothetical protein AAB885_02075 [Patescibacteria group bacterium]